MVKDHSDSKKIKPTAATTGLLFPIGGKGYFMELTLMDTVV